MVGVELLAAGVVTTANFFEKQPVPLHFTVRLFALVQHVYHVNNSFPSRVILLEAHMLACLMQKSSAAAKSATRHPSFSGT